MATIFVGENNSYLFITEHLKPGDYISIEKGKNYWPNNKVTKYIIELPNACLVLDEKDLEERGGLETVIKKIKEASN